MLKLRLTASRLDFKANPNILSGDLSVLKKPLVALCSALMVSSAFAVPSMAQSRNGQEANEPAVTDGGGRTRGARRQAQQRPVQLSPEQIKAEAQAVLTASSTACTVTDQRMLGTTGAGDKFFEVACDSAPGYLLIASTPAQAIDCVIVDHTAKQAGAASATPQGESTPKCELAGNQDIQGFLKAYATEAGIACTVDQVAVKGQSGTGAVIYEVGCAGADGYWIEKATAGWQKTECLQVINQGNSCAFTTAEEQAATVKSWLTGSEAADCNVGQIRLMGQNANGRFVEMTCDGAEGRIIRHNAEFQVQQTYLCSVAQQIGGGCTLPGNKPEEA